MTTRYKFIHFDQVPTNPGRKTALWGCLNNKSDGLLGIVEFDTGWRQYIFVAAGSAQFSVGCMKDIIHFIGQLEEARR